MEIFGVINASPDSLAKFSVVSTEEEAKEYGAELLAQGADHLDIGAQASHGDAAFVTADEEWQIIEGPLKGLLSLGVDVAIDTWQVETARRALDAGAQVLNAADALQTEAMMELVASREIQVVLPFMLGPDPRHLKHVEGDPVQVMVDWFDLQLERAERWGVRERLVLDPGTGFAPAHWDWEERFEYQKAIYTGLDRLRRFDLPIYVPIAWKQTADRLELIDLVLVQEVEYVRAHIPQQIRDRHAAIRAGNPLPTSDTWEGYE
ncbi:MAG: dihydropteroate synthase, partial [Acidimicrobiales bacterium]|jgi:dihydropteroate synthase|nr:dihydropteroate synthase [Acidimicrobiales bacterium]